MVMIYQCVLPGQIAEGTYNFTSTSEPKEMDDEEYEDERGSEDVEKEIDDDVQILGAMGPTQRIDEANSVNQGKFSLHNTSHSIKSSMFSKC